MSTNGLQPYDSDSMVVRPLTELPTLRLADAKCDVRGWEIRGRDGRRVGTVVDLLVNIDGLKADTLLVSLAAGDRAGALVAMPLSRLSPEHDSSPRLVPGPGMPPIVLRYQSTTHYALFVAIAVVVLVMAAWLLRLFD